MYCPQCGASTGDDARFCPACGKGLPEPVTADPVTPPAVFEAAPPDPPVAPEPPEFPPPPVFDPPAVPPAPAPSEPPAPAASAAPPMPVAAVPEARIPQAPAPVWTGWSKAPLFPRLVASFIDSLIMQPLVLPAYLWIVADAAAERVPVGGMVLAAVGGLWMLVYAYIKDGLKGASFGKRVMGLMVVNLKDNRPAGVGASILRALLLGLLGLIEAVMVLVDGGGQRIGDKVAKTQVVRMAEYEAAAPGWVRPGKGLAIGLLAASVAVGVLGSVAGGLALARAAAGASGPSVIEQPSAGPETEQAVDTERADVEAATRVVTGFYEGINNVDMDAVRAALAPELQDQAEPGAFEGWSKTTFEFTRGWIDGQTAHVVGRESQRAYGSGGDGGVEFTLARVGGSWLIEGWTAVDPAQVEGSDTPGSASGLPGPLTESTARDLVGQLLEARQTGTASVIRRLVTPRFAKENAGAWLDGIDNSEYFTDFEIVSVQVGAGAATVKVRETWVDGINTSTYGIVEDDGMLLVDTWSVQ